VPAGFGMSFYPETVRRRRNALQAYSVPARKSPDDRQPGLAQEAICHRRILVASAAPIHPDLLGAAQDQRQKDDVGLTPAYLVQPVPVKLSAHAHVDEHRAFGTEEFLAQGEQDVIPGAEGICTRHGRRAALMIGGSSQFMGAPRLGVYGSKSFGRLANWQQHSQQYAVSATRRRLRNSVDP
jgi:hypothetical protein